MTCLADAFFPQVGEAMVRVLHRLGVRLDFPEEQVCCGQPAFNAGYRDAAREVARGLVRAFAGSEAVVAPSGSCAGMIRHSYPELFRGDPMEAEALDLARKTFEFSEYVVGHLGVVDVGARFPTRATYHTSCHMSRLLGVRNPPLELLRHVDGLELVDLPHSEECCGFGGTFSVKMPEVSTAMGRRKADSVVATGAEVLIGSDAGCLMQIGGLLRRQGRSLPVMHVAQVLDGGVKR
ncbi:(Fe-S)-binding protein [Limnochorda pilosa]|uniref:(Fe-S)-binding protein n=1 Tax=Limnochorda pilosa TaxID=1555112 RepID=UPI00082FEE39